MSIGIIGNVYVGTMRTGSFDFMAIGDTQDDVRRRLAIGFQTHMHDAYKRDGMKLSNSPGCYKKVRARWAEENDFGVGRTGEFDAWIAIIDEYFGMRVTRFTRPTDVMRDGEKI